jgi:hypothetical protein
VPSEARLLIHATDADETYSTDDAGELAVRYGPRRPGDREQWMRTVRAGYHYAIYYHGPEEFGLQQWRWERAILMYALAARGLGIMAHASAFVAADRAVLVPGASGDGKSTLAKQVAERLGAAAVLSDDRVAVTVREGSVRAWGTPYYSSGRYSSGLDAPLGAIVFPGRSHGGPPALRDVPVSEALPRLLRAVGSPFWSDSGMSGMLDTLDTLLRSVPTYEYRYTPAAGAADPLLAALP